MVLGLLVSTAAGIPVLASHLIAAVLALLLLEGLSALAERLLGQPALGLGDAKLAALGGAWLGPGGIAARWPLRCLGSLGRKRRSPQWPVGPQGTVPLRSLHCPGHLAGLVDRSAVVVEHLGDAVGA